MALEAYRQKRKLGVTAEPRGRKGRGDSHQFVIQKHAARNLHYDLRLELDGVMKSWAVTRGPSLVPGEKRLAVHVEDHPVAYNTFEGTIPKGEYGGGTVLIWDRGRWEAEGDPHKGYAKGKLDFALDGHKLKGRWHLVRMRKRPGERQEPWLLIKSDDAAARSPNDPDILEEKPRSVVSRRTIEGIAKAAGAVWHSNRSVAANVKRIETEKKTKATKPAKAKKKAKTSGAKSSKARSSERAAPAKSNKAEAPVKFTHPDRIYWTDVDITKQQLADYYTSVWDRIAPHLVKRPLALLRCPAGIGGQCFFQKHAAAGLVSERIRRITDSQGEELIYIDDLDGLLTLVQAGALEIHVWGSTVDDIEHCNRIVFDFDPGDGVKWADVNKAARELRERLGALKLESFVKTSGGKGLHVVVPTDGTPWDETKDFAHAMVLAMEADSPDRYLAKMTKSLRKGKIFIDYLRNGRGATAVAAYSTRARPGATVSVPVEWDELGARLTPDKFTLLNIARRLGAQKRDPWAGMDEVRQRLPKLGRT